MIKLIAVHCSATRASQDIGAAEIDGMHRARGFSRIGYSYVIRRDGRLETGREEGAELAHAAGFNRNAIAVCMVGGVNDRLEAEANFTSAQFITLRKVLDFLALKYPAAVILGHRDLHGVQKDCPSFDVRRWISTAEIAEPKKRTA